METTRRRQRSGTGPWIELGRALARYRKAQRELSMRTLDERAGVSHSMVSLVERGHQRPSVDYLRKVAPVLQVPFLRLLTLAGYVGPDGQWLTDSPPAGVLAIAGHAEQPPDPLAALHAALEGGPWPEHISAAVYALLAAYAEQHRPLPDVDDPTLPAVATRKGRTGMRYRPQGAPQDPSPTEECRTDPAR